MRDPIPAPVHAADGRLLDTIEIRALHVNCIVGVYPGERRVPQPLEVDLALHLDTRRAGQGGSLRDTVDYARLSGELRFLLESCQFLLLETAADALCRYVLAPPTRDVERAPIEAVSLRLTKPHALDEAVPSLTVRRTAAEVSLPVEDKPFGQVDVVHQSASCGVYRLRVAPGRSIATHVHQVMDEAEMVLGSELLLQGKRVAPGLAFRWARGVAHRYDNPSSIEQTILCVDRPRFLPEDEREVPAPPGGLQPVTGVSYYPPEATER